jgi:toxin ParE1/3/4
MQIIWKFAAESDLDEIVRYIAQDSVLNALAFDDRVRERVGLLAEFPEAGKQGRVAGTRELISPPDRYCVVYTVEADVITILRVIHGGQDWPPEP